MLVQIKRWLQRMLSALSTYFVLTNIVVLLRCFYNWVCLPLTQHCIIMCSLLLIGRKRQQFLVNVVDCLMYNVYDECHLYVCLSVIFGCVRVCFCVMGLVAWFK